MISDRVSAGGLDPRAAVSRRVGSAWVRRAGEHAFLAPVLAVVAIGLLIPTGSVIYHAFTNWQPGYSSPFVGLSNFTNLAKSPAFQQVLKNQAFFLLGLPLWTLLPLVVATMLHERVPAPGVFRTIFFFPATASPALIGVLFSFMLGPAGPFNSLLHDIGLGGLARDWLVDAGWVKPVIIVVLAWATMGTGVVIFSAALSTVPTELFEAAQVDGARWRQRFTYVVLPSLRPVIQLWVVILVITVFVAIFPWIFTLTRGGPGYSSTTMDYDIYQNALQFGYFGPAAAEAVYLLVIIAVVVGFGAGMGRLVGRRRG